MAVETIVIEAGNVESIFTETAETPLSDELGRLRSMLLEQCPREAVVRFEFDGRLKVHIDVRTFEDVAAVEALLPSFPGGIFHAVERRTAGHHSFMHRVSAFITR